MPPKKNKAGGSTDKESATITISHRYIKMMMRSIHTTITTYLSDKDIGDNVEWMQTWRRWENSMLEVNTRAKLATLVRGEDNKEKTITLIQDMFTKLPLLNDVYEIKNGDDGTKIMEPKDLSAININTKTQSIINATPA